MAVPTTGARWWMLPHLLSVDAPAVAVAWQLAFSWALGARVLPAEALVLFLSVWLAYTTDRILDARRTGPTLRTARHRFAHAHRGLLLRALPLMLAIDLAVAWLWLPAESLRNGIPLALAAMAYAFAAQRIPGFGRWLVAKELAVGVIIAWGALWAPLSHGATWAHAWPLLGAGALVCGWNCVAISLWEAPFASWNGRALRSALLRVTETHFHLITLLGAVAACALGIAVGSLHGFAAGFTLGAAMVLLATLHRLDGLHRQDLRRVLADVVLLLPALLPLLHR